MGLSNFGNFNCTIFFQVRQPIAGGGAQAVLWTRWRLPAPYHWEFERWLKKLNSQCDTWFWSERFSVQFFTEPNIGNGLWFVPLSIGSRDFPEKSGGCVCAETYSQQTETTAQGTEAHLEILKTIFLYLRNRIKNNIIINLFLHNEDWIVLNGFRFVTL